jgi:adhesin transport system outer membrane protein
MPQLPTPTIDPLRIDFTTDPILRLSDSTIAVDEFRAVLASALSRHPARLEAIAGEEEAEAALAEARERLFPSGEVTLTSYKTLAREFSNDPFNIIERSRPEQRTDALLNIQQTVIDFGATSRRIAAAGARLRAASASEQSVADQLALRAIATWYDVVAYQALVAVSLEFAAMQEEFREAVRIRIRQGVSAEGDLARAESYIASAETRRAQLQRALAQAEARFEELTGTPPAPSQPRAPRLGADPPSRELAVSSARSSPQVRAAEAEAEAARQDYRAARSDLLPNVTAGIDAGRYGVFENDRDYDVRARVTLRQRLFGGAEPRAEQAGARARAVEARAERIRQEAERDASIAWSDVQALEAELAALRESYIASRRSRDILFERFRVARGSLFDVLEANEAYFGTAVAYVQAISELDAARYALLSRTGQLLEALDIEPSSSAGGQ